jgi:hypothetical protein
MRDGNHRDHGWTAEELALLGTTADADVAAQIGRTTATVCVMRTTKGIANARDQRRRDS